MAELKTSPHMQLKHAKTAQILEQIHKMDFKFGAERLALEKQMPLLKADRSRIFSLPIKYPNIQKLVKLQQASHWLAEDVDLSGDLDDWKKLSPGIQHYFTTHLVYLFGSDGIIIENLGQQFLQEVQIPEVRGFYCTQLAMESVHGESYALILETLLGPDAVVEAIEKQEKYPVVIKKQKWAEQWITPERSFVERLIAFFCVEAIHFSGSFCAFFWMKRDGKMPGACQMNDYISRDEGQHATLAATVYQELVPEHLKLSQNHIYMILSEAVDVDVEFNTVATNPDMIGMNPLLMERYIKFIADQSLEMLGCDPLYHCQNPFMWMERICLQSQTNFFEKRVTEYHKPGILDEEEEDGEYFSTKF